MNLTIKDADQLLAQSKVTVEQIHYILNYLGQSYHENNTQQKEPEK